MNDAEPVSCTEQTNVYFWNVHGFANVLDLSFLLQPNDVICLVETWRTDVLQSCHFNGSNFYEVSCSPAQKGDQRGRPSGGLAIFTSKDKYNTIILAKRENYIFSKLTTDNFEIIIGLVYFSPKINFVEELGKLTETFQDIICKFPNTSIIVGGDFNARVGSLNQLPEEFDLCNNFLRIDRHTLDPTTTRNGKILIECMEQNDLILLNGRSKNDCPAQFTFMNSLGTSVIDLVWCNQNCIEKIVNFKVNDVPTRSDHLPLVIALKTGLNISKNNNKVSKLVWKDDCFLDYQALFNEQLLKRSTSIDIDENYEILIESIYATANQLEMVRTFDASKVGIGKPWFDGDCHKMKYEVQVNLKNIKKQNYSKETRLEWERSKKNYKNFLNKKKSQYRENIINSLANVSDSAGFWSLINKYRKQTPSNQAAIKLCDWFEYYNKQFPTRIYNDTDFFDVRHPHLDDDISYMEMIAVLNKSKNKKAPGPDGIPFEFLKSLPCEGLNYLQTFFNTILNQESPPKKWGNIFFSMIYKKGDKFDPSNYRPIALVSCLLKTFSMIINNRLHIWSEELHLVPEFQAGFRKRRSCADHIFTLNSIIQIHLRQKRSKVFALFVDFKSAFPSVNHNILWHKLFKIGLSAKIIRILRKIYEHANGSVKQGSRTSEAFEITEGVLQGEVLSPILFSLFISDIEEFFRSRGITGISVDHLTEIILLAYADDIVFLAKSKVQLRKILKVLSEYCQLNQLMVNSSKTKIIVFQKGGYYHVKKLNPFVYNDEVIEVTNNYTYLGIPFSCSAVFSNAAETTTSKSLKAVNSTLSLIRTTEIDSWKAIVRLNESLVNSCLLNNAYIWGLQYTDKLEKIQMTFYKKLLRVPLCTPGCAVRIETGVTPISRTIFKQILKWLIKILEMPDTRYPKIAFNKLLTIAREDNNHIKKFFSDSDSMYLWNNLSLELLRRDFQQVLIRYENYLRNQDLSLLASCTALTVYPYLPICEGRQNYLKIRMNNLTRSLFAQLRLLNSNAPRILFRTIRHDLRNTGTCQCCNVNTEETLYHILVDCPAYNSERKKFLTENKATDDIRSLWLPALNPKNIPETKSAFYFISTILKRREFYVEIMN